MKPAQWMAVLLLALMVGGITFVMVYLGSSGAHVAVTPTPKTTAGLTFGQKKYPGEGDKAMTTEVNKTGHQDFWFVNDSGQDVPVGMNSKSCTCTQVELAIAPESWKSRWLEEAAGRVLQQASLLLPSQELNGLQTLASYAPKLSESEVNTTLLTRDNSFTVPAGAFGWVRLTWQKPEARALNTSAELWMGHRDSTTSARLEASVLIARPMEVNPEVSAGSFSLRDLEKGKQMWIVCWSMTRPSFTVKVQQDREHKAESDAVEVGQPIPLSAEDLRHLEQSERVPLQILSAYRIPVTLHAKAKDGTPIEWGHLRRYVSLTSDDPGIEPVQVKVTGDMHGAVAIGNGNEGKTINLGPFARSRGARGDIVLQTDVKGLDLKLDRARVPEYLKVRFPQKPEVSPSGHREWLLEVEVPRNAASGEFPRSDNPVYRDSAIYVTTNENPPRSIRVPVAGAANAN
ncbi:MAG TPA: hypothetical protein VH682_29635 [Gemmataceae bacterium]|jgi:hypothetical protein